MFFRKSNEISSLKKDTHFGKFCNFLHRLNGCNCSLPDLWSFEWSFYRTIFYLIPHLHLKWTKNIMTALNLYANLTTSPFDSALVCLFFMVKNLLKSTRRRSCKFDPLHELTVMAIVIILQCLESSAISNLFPVISTNYKWIPLCGVILLRINSVGSLSGCTVITYWSRIAIISGLFVFFQTQKIRPDLIHLNLTYHVWI